jgi:hypothetical protein
MKRALPQMILAMSLLLGAMAAPSFAQDGPPPPPPTPGDQGGPDMRGPGGGIGPGPGMRPPPPEMRRMEILRGYMDLVQQFTALSRDPTTAAVMAVSSANDLLHRDSPQAAIDYFNKMLPQVKDQTVQRAIRIKLIDLYKETGQTDKALEQLNDLMLGGPASSASGRASP